MSNRWAGVRGWAGVGACSAEGVCGGRNLAKIGFRHPLRPLRAESREERGEERGGQRAGEVKMTPSLERVKV